MLKVVDIGIYQAVVDYAELIKILEAVADKYIQNKLTAPSAKEQYFRAILLFLANDDEIGANMALERYINNDPTFFQTRQHKFCVALIKSLKEKNLTLFSDEWYIYFNVVISSMKSFLWINGKPQFLLESKLTCHYPNKT